jgi:O-antigen/teichoic acid export membrane protein
LTQPNAKIQPEEVDVRKKKHIGVGAFVSTFGTNLIIQACTVLQGILVARMLGPVGRGEYAAVTLWPLLFGSFGVMGIYIALGRIAAKTDDYAALVRSGIALALMTSVISAIACYFALPWVLPESEKQLIPLARLFILVIPLIRLIMNLNTIDQGRGDFKQFNLIRSIFNPVYVLLLLAVWMLNLGNVRWCVIAMLIGYLAAVIIWLITAVRRYSLIGKLYSLKDIVIQSIPFSLAGIFQVLYMHIDKALMLWLLGTQNLGLYTVALSASAVAGSITVSTGMVSFTMAAQADHGDGFEHLAKTFRLSAILWIIIGSILAVVMPFVLPLVYGRDFAEAIGPAQLLIIGSALAGLADMLEQAVRGQGKAYIGLEGRLAGLIILSVLSILLADKFGISGFCLAFIVGQMVCLCVIVWRTNKHYSIKTVIAYIPCMDDIDYLIKWCIGRLNFVNIKKTDSR